MITIEILEIKQDDSTNSQHIEFAISDGIDTYAWRRGAIPIELDTIGVQALLDGEAEKLWVAASARAEPVPGATAAGAGARAWAAANPNAKLLFDLPIADLEAEIYSLVDAVLPLATPGQRARMKLLLMTYGLTVRVLAKREGLI